ncbi:helix-turn-helix domain-containing protein [Halomonas sp. V046]|uniref:helix-turn-helix domain-containing protein n=1 Tax=Halomonas sp. V046 TaxID=3459611 RepID=UPI0040444AF4
MYLVRSGAAEQIERLIHDCGENPVAIIRQAGLRQSQFRDPDTYIAYHKLAELLELGALRCQRPLFGLELVARQTLGVLGDLPIIVSRATTVGEALTAANNFLYLHASGICVEQRRQADRVRLALTLNTQSAMGIRQLMQLSVAHLALFVAGLLDRNRLTIALYLRQPAPEVLQPTGFRQVYFDQAFDGIYLDARDLESPSHRDEARLNEHLRLYLAKLQSHYPGCLEDQVQDTISRLLPTGECSVDWVASALGLHPRTLQIRLKQAGTSYRNMLQATRQGLAERLLREGKIAVTDLALQLGYSEVAVFSRHFRRWTGQSPRQWQASQRETPG